MVDSKQKTFIETRPAVLGFPEKPIESGAWSVEMDNTTAKIPLPYINLYRHICVNCVAEPRLYVVTSHKDAPHLINDNIEIRMQQLNLLSKCFQGNVKDHEYKISVENKLPFIVSYTSDQIKPVGNSPFPIVNPGIVLFDLFPKCSFQATLKIRMLSPLEDAKYSCIMVSTQQSHIPEYDSMVIPKSIRVNCYGFYSNMKQINDLFQKFVTQHMDKFVRELQDPEMFRIGQNNIEFNPEDIDNSILTTFVTVMSNKFKEQTKMELKYDDDMNPVKLVVLPTEDKQLVIKHLNEVIGEFEELVKENITKLCDLDVKQV